VLTEARLVEGLVGDTRVHAGDAELAEQGGHPALAVEQLARLPQAVRVSQIDGARVAGGGDLDLPARRRQLGEVAIAALPHDLPVAHQVSVGDLDEALGPVELAHRNLAFQGGARSLTLLAGTN
jgi:hypothetical protein